MKVREALAVAERDDVGVCATCSALALDDERFCLSCKDYWENDAPALTQRDVQQTPE